MQNHSKNDAAYAKIVAKAWKDSEFKKKLMADPKKVLKENGVDLPKDVKVRCVEKGQKEITFVLPDSPANSVALDDVELSKIAAAVKNKCSWVGSEFF